MAKKHSHTAVVKYIIEEYSDYNQKDVERYVMQISEGQEISYNLSRYYRREKYRSFDRDKILRFQEILKVPWKYFAEQDTKKPDRFWLKEWNAKNEIEVDNYFNSKERSNNDEYMAYLEDVLAKEDNEDIIYMVNEGLNKAQDYDSSLIIKKNEINRKNLLELVEKYTSTDDVRLNNQRMKEIALLLKKWQ